LFTTVVQNGARDAFNKATVNITSLNVGHPLLMLFLLSGIYLSYWLYYLWCWIYPQLVHKHITYGDFSHTVRNYKFWNVVFCQENCHLFHQSKFLFKIWYYLNLYISKL